MDRMLALLVYAAGVALPVDETLDLAAAQLTIS